MTFKQKGREESCEMDDPEPGQKICQLYGIENWQLFYGNFIRPKIKVRHHIIIHHLIINITILHLVLIMILKVGTEWVYKGQNADNCLNAVAALARTMYNRLFLWLVDLCNRALIDQTMKSNLVHRKNYLFLPFFPQRSTSSESWTSLVCHILNFW